MFERLKKWFTKPLVDEPEISEMLEMGDEAEELLHSAIKLLPVVPGIPKKLTPQEYHSIVKDLPITFYDTDEKKQSLEVTKDQIRLYLVSRLWLLRSGDVWFMVNLYQDDKHYTLRRLTFDQETH